MPFFDAATKFPIHDHYQAMWTGAGVIDTYDHDPRCGGDCGPCGGCGGIELMRCLHCGGRGWCQGCDMYQTEMARERGLFV